MDVTVRQLGQGDESTLIEIVLRNKARSITSEYATRLLANPSNLLLVAERKQHPVGFIWGYLLPRIDRESCQLFIYEVEVLPGARMRGVGASLMNFVAICTKANHLMEAFVLTDMDNVAAQRLYVSTGASLADGKPTIYIYGGGSAP